MSRAQSLLDRIAAWERSQPRGRNEPTTAEDPEALVESIRRNLTRLLNARHGLSAALPDYGLPALADMVAGRDDCADRLQEAIRTAIEKYEPRLRRVRVTRRREDEGGQTPIFRIDAVVVGQRREHGVWYETSLTPDGAYRVLG